MPQKLKSRRIAELDGIRGLAILSVLFYHFFWWGSDGNDWHGLGHYVWKLAQVGWAGVNLFFVLSGFLITGILLDAKDRPHFFKNFYGRRAVRIIPAYALTLAIIYFYYPNSGSFVMLGFFFIANLAGFFQIDPTYPVLWSISIEEHFYLFWPLLVRFTKKNTFTFICIAIVLIEPILRGTAFAVHFSEEKQPWCRFDSLAWGGLIALFVRSRFTSRRNLGKLATLAFSMALFLGIIGSPMGIMTRRTLMGAALSHTIIDLGMSALVLFALSVEGSRWGKPLAKGFLPRWGAISYSAYLLHCLLSPQWEKLNGLLGIQPGVGYATAHTLFGIGMTYVLASLSFRFVESPALKLRRHFAEQKEATVVLEIPPKIPGEVLGEVPRSRLSMHV